MLEKYQALMHHKKFTAGKIIELPYCSSASTITYCE
jgi:hypothetical protein